MKGTDNQNQTPEAAVIADLAREATLKRLTPQQGAYLDASPFVILRDANGFERIAILRDIDEPFPPHRKTGTVKLNDAPSFIAYYRMHGALQPIYATLKPAQFVAVLNDHTADAAGHRDFRAEFKVGHSTEWGEWMARSGADKAFGSTTELALFLEDNAPDIIDPSAGEMLEIALNFRVNADVSFSSAQRLQDGHVDFAYANLVTAEATGKGGKIRIPETFKIEIPVWDGINAAKYEIDARFRYRQRDGKLTIWYELIRPHKVMEQAFKDLWAQIRSETAATILHGTP